MPFGAIIGSIAAPVIGGLLGGSSSRGGTQTVQNSVPPVFSGLANTVAQLGQGFATLPYQPYPYATVAEFNPYQFQAFDMIANRAGQPGGLPQQAESTLGRTLAGGYQAPQAVNPYRNASTEVGANPYIGATTPVGRNPYAGANPYLEQAISNAQGDVVRQFNQQVAPSQAAVGLRSGSFGNSGLQAAENESRRQLAGELGRISSGMRMGDYGMQQQLAESDIARRLGATQADIARNAGLSEAGIGRELSAGLADINRNAGLYESQFGRGMDAWNAERNRQMGALGLAPSIYGLGYAPAQQLLGIGGTMQQQAQNVLGGWQDQFNQSQQWPFRIYDAMMAPFGRNIGSTSTTSGPSGNRVAGMLGGAMLGNQFAQSPTGQQFGNWIGGLFNGGGTPSGTPQFWGVGAQPY